MARVLKSAVTAVSVTAFGASVWTRLVSLLVRRHVERIERPVSFEPVLGLCEEGKPIFLHDPSYDTTLVFFDGFRIRPAVSMHRAWLEQIHREQQVNVLAPVLGRQSMSFRMRGRDWTYLDECRASAQIIEAYRTAHGVDHRIVVAGFSWGAVHCYSLAALGLCDAIVLISPLPHRTDVQIERAVHTRGMVAKLLRWALTNIFAGRGYGLIGRVFPYYVRPGVSGGWDIADPELRKEHNRKTLNGQELRIYDVYEIVDSISHVKDQLLPRIRNTDVSVVWGQKDSIIVEAVFEDLVRVLTEMGNRTYAVPVPGSGHNLLQDVGDVLARRAVADAIARQRADHASRLLVDITL